MNWRGIVRGGAVFLSVILMLLAVLVTALRFGLPDLQPHRDWILKQLLPDTVSSASVAQIGWRWQDYGLQLELRDVALRQQGAVPFELSAKQLQLHCNPFLQFWKTHGCLATLQADQLQLTLNLPKAAASSAESPDLNDVLPLLLEQFAQANITDSQIRLFRQQQLLAEFHIDQLYAENRGGAHKLFSRISVAQQALVVPLLLQAELQGAARQDALQGHIYLATEPHASKQPGALLPTPLAVNAQSIHGSLAFQLWLERQPGQWQSALLQLGLNRLGWQQAEQQHSLELQGGEIVWQRHADDWQLYSQGLQLHSDNQPWRSWQLQLNKQAEQYTGQMDPLLLSELTPLAGMLLPVESAASEALRTLTPQGRLSEFRFSRDEAQDSWQFSGQMEQLQWQRWRMIPGLHDVDASFHLSPQGVALTVQQLKPQTWDLQPYFEKPWPVEAFSAVLNWQKLSDGWALTAEQVQLKTDVVTTATQFRLSQEGKQPLFLALDSGVDLKDASQAHYYFPHGAMGEPVIKYLTSALQGGHAENARILWHGAFRDFPFKEKNGIFQAWVPLRDATFQFGAGWLPLREMSLDLLFENDRLDMQGDHALLGDASSPRLHAWFPKLAPGARLYIDADIAGTGEAVSDYLYRSPLQNSVGSALQAVRIQKPLTGELKLDIPMDGSQVKVNGKVKLAGNSLYLPSLDLPLEQLQGELSFDDNKTAIEELQATLWGQPLRVQYAGEQQADEYQVKLGLQGEWDSQRDKVLPQLAHQTLQGRANWQGTLDLHLYKGGHYYYDARLTSPLTSLALDLPAPYNKPAGRNWPLQVKVSGNQNSSVINGSLNHEWQLQADWAPDQKQFRRFWLDNQVIERSTGPRLPFSVSAILSEADVSAWLDWWQRWPKNGLQTVNQLFPSVGAVDVRVDKLHLADQLWRDVRFNMSPDRDGNRIWLESSKAQGMIHLPASKKKPIRIDMARLYWADSGEDKPAEPPMSLSTQQAWLARWPDLLFSCQDCRYGGNTLGQFRGHLSPVKQGGEIRDLHWQVANSHFDGQASWLINNYQPLSALKGKFVSNNTEVFLGHFGFDPGLTGTKSEMDIDVSWPGALIQPRLEALSGQISAETGEGVLREVNNTGGNRLLSLFSLNAIVSRISFDFRDIFGDGLYFKKISFSGKLDRGVLRNDDLLLESHSGELKGHGLVDLGRKTIDYQVTFSPTLTGGFGVATAFAITPITGIAVLAATTILQPVFDVITQVSYSVNGNIAKPVITELGRKQEKVKLPSPKTEESK
ncbi:YhdP family protein [Tolumonas osonensis]|uniref:Uncharacterized protein (TIGR02099 family) n=1 Tax=Tolumonas osonensis TaxID=675874 RepID=A0A841GQL0_9GAMM|nr:uncharacterized protein (TIGR02099 family) [Tolumonas osonensis]